MKVDPHSETLVGEAAAAKVSGAFDTAAPTMAGRYQLLGLLGAGAMGTVYRAMDNELEEVVALKVLKKELAAAKGMLDRFRREVKLARRVTHRNVARTYDIGEHGGDRFLTMEFIEGEMLGSMLERRGRLAPFEVLALAADVCAGLGAAHAANVLHRDLKPENIIVAKDGRAVITDFGIARAIAESELARTHGGIAGTPAYMSPEQVEGAPDLDARTDLYALGTMMYELLSGQVAWPGDSIVAIAAGRLLRPPPDVRAKVPDVPDPVAELVLKLMARRKDGRFESAEQTFAAIERIRSTTARAEQVTTKTRRPAATIDVAVLPVIDRESSGADEYLARSLTEDIVDLLSVVPKLRVRPRGEAARHADPARDVREAGRVLGVDVVVDATLRRIEGGVRVSVRLVTVEDGFQLWAQRFERPITRVLDIADEAATAIARVLTSELAVHPRSGTADAEAQDLYLRGRFMLHRAWYEISRDAVRLLDAAYQRAPNDARIAGTYAIALARAQVNDLAGTHDPAHVRSIVARALELDPASGDARCASGLLFLGDGNSAGAAAAFLDALDVAPSSPDALDALGRVLNESGQYERGVELLRQALAVEPTLNQARFQMARVRSLLGDEEGFFELLGKAPAHPGDYVPWLLMQARTYLWRLDIAGAGRLAKDAEGAIGLPPGAREAVRRMLEAASGALGDASFEAMQKALPVGGGRISRRRGAFNAQLLTEIAVASGRNDAAFEALAAADANLLFDVLWIDRCAGLEPLRSDPRFTVVRDNVATRADAVTKIVEARFSAA
jgi:eukaryotic-like serine/threonine-protein kinase